MFFFSVTSLSPICCRIFSIDIYWYGIAYVLGISLALLYAKYFFRVSLNTLQFKDFDAFFPFACLGIVVGGRLGHVLFYDFSYYMHNILDIFKIREGGMSFHGGLIGVILLALWFCKKHRLNPYSFMDILSAIAPIGLGIGRIANFINGELYGKPTLLPFGVYFHGVSEPRHPTQLYEALTEGLITFFILKSCSKTKFSKKNPGFITALFLICYSFFRIMIDFLKDSPHYYGGTMGQWLSSFMLISGIIFIKLQKDKKKISQEYFKGN